MKRAGHGWLCVAAAMVLVTANACSRNDPERPSGSGGSPGEQGLGGTNSSAGGGNGELSGPGGLGGGGTAGQGGFAAGLGGGGGGAPGPDCPALFTDGGAVPDSAGGVAALALANLRGAGKRDLVVVDQAALRTFANDGTGYLYSLGTYTTSMPSAGLATGDLNGDGLADVVVVPGVSAGSSPAVGLPLAVFLNRGDGTLAPAGSCLPPFALTAVAIGDIDGDHLPDLVASGVGTYVFLNQGGGTFATAQALASDGGQPALADLDGDGKLDLALAVPSLEKVEVLFNQGALAFSPPGSVSFNTRFPSLGLDAQSLVATDLNADGAVDLVVLGRVPMVDQGERSLAIAFNDGTGVFTAGYGTQVPQDAGALAVGDFNRDGRVDLAVSSVATLGSLQGGITALLATSGATYTVAVCPTLLGSLASSISVMVGGDLNGDGRADLVVARPDGVGVLFSAAP